MLHHSQLFYECIIPILNLPRPQSNSEIENCLDLGRNTQYNAIPGDRSKNYVLKLIEIIKKILQENININIAFSIFKPNSLYPTFRQ